jgi:trans-aconitate methyltransferase
MQSQETASRYDRLAEWWQTQHQNSSYGLAALARAIRFVAQRGAALDVGCGSSGRFITHLAQHGFQVEGLDVSREMIRLAQRLHPAISFTVADICEWTPPRPYSLIAASFICRSTGTHRCWKNSVRRWSRAVCCSSLAVGVTPAEK